MGQGAIHLSGSDRSPSGRIGYTQLACVCVSVCVRKLQYCTALVANEIYSLRRARDEGEREMQKRQRKDFREVEGGGRSGEGEVWEKNGGMGKSRDKADGKEGWVRKLDK